MEGLLLNLEDLLLDLLVALLVEGLVLVVICVAAAAGPAGGAAGPAVPGGVRVHPGGVGVARVDVMGDLAADLLLVVERESDTGLNEALRVVEAVVLVLSLELTTNPDLGADGVELVGAEGEGVLLVLGDGVVSRDPAAAGLAGSVSARADLHSGLLVSLEVVVGVLEVELDLDALEAVDGLVVLKESFLRLEVNMQSSWSSALFHELSPLPYRLVWWFWLGW